MSVEPLEVVYEFGTRVRHAHCILSLDRVFPPVEFSLLYDQADVLESHLRVLDLAPLRRKQDRWRDMRTV